MYSSRYSNQILMRHEFSRQIFEKYSNRTFNESLVGVDLFHADGRAGGRTGRQADYET
jgi:hypothetical protein